MFAPRQYDMFESQDEVSQLQTEFEALHKACDNVRRGLFARHKKLEESDNLLLKMILEQQEEIDQLKKLLIKRKK